MERHRSGSRPTKRRRDGSSSSRTSSNESCDTRKKKKKRKSSDGRGQPASPKSRRVSSRTDLKSHATRHKKHKPGTSDKHKHKKHESSRHKRKIVHSSSSSSYSDSDSSDVESCSEGSSSDSTEVERKRHKLKHRHKPRHKKAKKKTPKTSISKSKHKKCITAPPSAKSSISKATDSTQETPAVKKPGGEKGTTVTKQRGPMTKEEWERQQGIVRRVYDPDTGRHRLVKGDGEVVEEIASRDRQKDINKQATAGDSMSFQQGLRKLL